MSYVIYPSKNTSLKMATIGDQYMYWAMLFMIQYTYKSLYALVGHISHIE